MVVEVGSGNAGFDLALLDLWHVVPIGDGVGIGRAGVSVMLLDIGLILPFPARRSAWTEALAVPPAAACSGPSNRKCAPSARTGFAFMVDLSPPAGLQFPTL